MNLGAKGVPSTRHRSGEESPPFSPERCLVLATTTFPCGRRRGEDAARSGGPNGPDRTDRAAPPMARTPAEDGSPARSFGAASCFLPPPPPPPAKGEEGGAVLNGSGAAGVPRS